MKSSLLLTCAQAAVTIGAIGLAGGHGVEAGEIVRTVEAVSTAAGDPDVTAAAGRAHRWPGPRATSARAEAAKQAARRRHEPATAPVGSVADRLRPQAIVTGSSFAGQHDPASTESDATGAVGPTRYVQLVQARFGIYGRPGNKAVGTGTLQQLAGVSAAYDMGGQQVIWDAATNRFYYSASGGTGYNDNILFWGFSKTDSPNAVADWCRYQIKYDPILSVDFPRLGDSQYFLIIGANLFDYDDYAGSEILAIPKPPVGTTCPAASTFKATASSALRTKGGGYAVSPLPANAIDGLETGYVVGVEEYLPANRLWLFDVTRSKTGAPVIATTGRALAVPSYDYPPDARQGGAGQLIDTLDGRPTQAVLSRNPSRGDAPSIWTQHTIAAGDLSAVRWYELKPTAPASVLRSATYTLPGTYLYNAAISSDRRVDGATAQFGNSFVLTYNASSAVNRSNPRIVAGASLNGGPYLTTLVKDAVGPYTDKSLCPQPGYVCPWSAQAGAAPDPRPAAASAGAVWLTNQYVGAAPGKAGTSIWRSWIAAFTP